MDHLKSKIRNVPDFPKPGILFYDITTLLSDARGFSDTVHAIAAPYMGEDIDAVIGIESRGFILGAAVASVLGSGFVPIRKPGKLPAKTVRESYSLEYGADALEMHDDAVGKGERVLDPLHYLVTLQHKPAALDHAPVYRDWQLPAAFGQLRRSLEQKLGASAGVRQGERLHRERPDLELGAGGLKPQVAAHEREWNREIGALHLAAELVTNVEQNFEKQLLALIGGIEISHTTVILGGFCPVVRLPVQLLKIGEDAFAGSHEGVGRSDGRTVGRCA